MKFKTANHLSTAPISSHEAQELIDARASYDYPRAHVLRATAATHDIQIAPNLYGSFSVPGAGEVTDTTLDTYHYRLLWSAQHEERILGLVSVVYWGYYTFGHEYAANKVDWLINGNKTQPATTPHAAYAHTVAAQNHLERKDMGEALASLQGLSQLNRTPFASKVIAFMAPSIAGVYDNRIADGLALETWTRSINDGIGQTNSRKVMMSYQAWCIYISQVASQLNLGISLGRKWEWSCGLEKGQHWRALDVERALFAIFGNSKPVGGHE